MYTVFTLSPSVTILFLGTCPPHIEIYPRSQVSCWDSNLVLSDSAYVSVTLSHNITAFCCNTPVDWGWLFFSAPHRESVMWNVLPMSPSIISLKAVLILIHADQNEAPSEAVSLASKPDFCSE